MPTVEQMRDVTPRPLMRPRAFMVVCSPLRSQVNLSSIARTAGCFGLQKIVACGNGRVHSHVVRDSQTTVTIEVHRTVAPVALKLRQEGYFIVALEQTDRSTGLYDFQFPRKTALVVGNERTGVSDELLSLADVCLEIPVWGAPGSHNVATATALAIGEYCRQYPDG